MSGYENVVAGKLKLKGKALDVKAGGIKKKKKVKSKILSDQIIQMIKNEMSEDYGWEPKPVDKLTAAERRNMEQKQKIEMQRLAKTANKSHRDRISEFS